MPKSPAEAEEPAEPEEPAEAEEPADDSATVTEEMTDEADEPVVPPPSGEIREIMMDANQALRFTDPEGNVIPDIPVVPGEDRPVRHRQHRGLRAQLLHRHRR